MTVPWTARMLLMYITDWTSYNIYFLWLTKSCRNQWKLHASCDHNTEVFLILRYFAQRRVLTSMTVHMETVYAADKNVTGFDVSWIRTTVPWIARMPPMSTSLVWTATNILWMGEEFRRNQQTRRTPVQPPYRISRFSDISLNDVLYFHDCAHGDRSTPTRMSRVSTFPGFRTTVPWIVLTPRTTSRDWTKPPLYFLWLEKNPAGIKLTDASDHRTEYSRFSRYFAQRRVLHFHDCTWRQFTPRIRIRFRCFLGTPRRCHG
jgi:hypothetical protein